jgi:hypothetical protein
VERSLFQFGPAAVDDRNSVGVDNRAVGGRDALFAHWRKADPGEALSEAEGAYEAEASKLSARAPLRITLANVPHGHGKGSAPRDGGINCVLVVFVFVVVVGGGGGPAFAFDLVDVVVVLDGKSLHPLVVLIVALRLIFVSPSVLSLFGLCQRLNSSSTPAF